MRLLGTLGVLCLIATPAMGGASEYVFEISGGGIILQIIGAGSTNSAMVGTFSAVIDTQSDGHVGESDTIQLLGGNWITTDPTRLVIGGIATANIGAGSARVSDFIQPVPAHIGPGGATVIHTDAFLNATVVVTGAFNTTFQTSTAAGTLLPLPMILSTSAGISDIITATISLVFNYEIGIPDITQTITLDLIMNLEATAHVPDPSLGGLTALGLAGAGTWLRNRRK